MSLVDGVKNFLGSNDRASASEYGRLADQDRQDLANYQEQAYATSQARRTAEQGYIDSQQERYDSTYAPIEQQLSSEARQGAQYERMAGIAGTNFSNEFDASSAARDRQQLRQGVSYGEGSRQGVMQGENDAFNKARGIATSQTNARRVEDDSAFIKQNAFYNANANSIQSRVQQGMSTMYGNQASAYNTAASQSLEQAQYNQGVSDQYVEQSKAGTNMLAGILGQGVGAAASGIFGG